MKKINLDELKLIQLDILSVIDKFCREEGIKYSMGCGTMFGFIIERGCGCVKWECVWAKSCYENLLYKIRWTNYTLSINLYAEEVEL